MISPSITSCLSSASPPPSPAFPLLLFILQHPRNVNLQSSLRAQCPASCLTSPETADRYSTLARGSVQGWGHQHSSLLAFFSPVLAPPSSFPLQQCLSPTPPQLSHPFHIPVDCVNLKHAQCSHIYIRTLLADLVIIPPID